MSEKGVWYRLVKGKEGMNGLVKGKEGMNGLVKGKEGMNGLSNINFFSVIFLNSI